MVSRRSLENDDLALKFNTSDYLIKEFLFSLIPLEGYSYLASVDLIFMNFEIILGLRTHPFSSESWMGRFWLSEASQDLTRISNSPEERKKRESDC